MSSYRTGRAVGRTLYRQLGDEPSDDDALIGIVDTPELAADFVRAANAHYAEAVTTTREPDDSTAVMAFLAAHLAYRGPHRCTGASSDALVTWALAGAVPPPSVRPYDQGDLAACERTVELAPPALAARMGPVVNRWRDLLRGERKGLRVRGCFTGEAS